MIYFNLLLVILMSFLAGVDLAKKQYGWLFAEVVFVFFNAICVIGVIK